jgi:hypothetical protein
MRERWSHCWWMVCVTEQARAEAHVVESHTVVVVVVVAVAFLFVIRPERSRMEGNLLLLLPLFVFRRHPEP